MVRALFYLLTTVIVITVVKSVIGIFAKAFSNVAQQQQPPRAPGQAPGPGRQAPQTLKKDPVCGTFVASSTEFQKTKGGTTHYFCSAACRDKF